VNFHRRDNNLALHRLSTVISLIGVYTYGLDITLVYRLNTETHMCSINPILSVHVLFIFDLCPIKICHCSAMTAKTKCSSASKIFCSKGYVINRK